MTKRPSCKLDNRPRYHGTFRITRKFEPNSYHVELPSTLKNHPVFHISNLSRVAKDPYRRQIVSAPLPVFVDKQEEYHVEEIWNAHIWGWGKKPKYLVKWVGYK